MFLFEIIDPFVKLTGADWMTELNFGTITLRLVLAVILGGIIGIERALKHHAAGFRTYIIVCLGSTIAMLTNEFLSRATNMGDGARLGAQVISGIGFLGAGTIMFTSRNQVKGLTTAAGLWASACLGLAIGIGFYTLAIIASIIIISVLAILPSIELFLTTKSKHFAIHIEFGCRENLKEFIQVARNLNFQILSIEHNPAYSQSGLSVYTIVLKALGKNKATHTDYLNEFKALSYVSYVEEIF